MDKTFTILTLGCKLNQFESEWIREALLRRGWEHRRFENGASCYIINSCTVTGRSDARCRNAARRTRKAAPEAFVVVTGCYAETQPERLAAMSEVDLVLGNDRKGSLPAILDRLAASGRGAGVEGSSRIPAASGTDPIFISRFLDHSRAFVKVQEGCNSSCSYCIVPRARGVSRSVPEEAVLDQVRVLRASGYNEIVLTGIHIGRYGADLEPPRTLASLVESLLEHTDTPRIRLSSIEPNEVTPGILGLLRETNRLAPHLHIPLQSGDDTVLSAMNRPYRAADFRNRIEEVALVRDAVAIGTDVIVGFPGETERCFENTYALLRDLPITHFHVFPFSPRPFTAAAGMRGAVDPGAKKERSARLIELGTSKKRAFEESHVGSVQLALVEGPAADTRGFVRCRTGTYCEVLIPAGCAEAGALVPVYISRLSRKYLLGTPAGGDCASEGGRLSCVREKR
jgi:threonylcarbamoyladenosine tRNA methylthiotransferase MtaB